MAVFARMPITQLNKNRFVTGSESYVRHIILQKGLSLYAEADGDHKGVNVIGATEIQTLFKPHYSIYSFREGIKALHVGRLSTS